jgi:hypothetical protein
LVSFTLVFIVTPGQGFGTQDAHDNEVLLLLTQTVQ